MRWLNRAARPVVNASRVILGLLKESVQGWQDDNGWRLGAALAYFAVFSTAPMLIIIISLTGKIFGRETVRSRLLLEIHAVIGPQGAEAIDWLLRTATRDADLGTTLFGVAMLIVGATALFIQLRQAVNTIWQVEEKPRGKVRDVVSFFKARAIAFLAVLCLGGVLIISLTLSTGLSIARELLAETEAPLFPLIGALDFVISFAGLTLVIAAVLKVLPNARLPWRDAFVGGFATAFLFTVGKSIVALYLANSSVTSSFGAARSLVIVLLWAFFSAQFFLFGAELTKVFARRYGRQIVPDRNSVRVVTERIKVKQDRKN